MFNWIKSTSIKIKIITGLILIFLIFCFQSFLAFSSFKEIEKSFNDLSLISKESINILNIDKELLNLQRLALVYSNSGSKSVLRQMLKKQNEILLDLDEARKLSRNEFSTDMISKMVKLLIEYKENILQLGQKFLYKEKLLNLELPNVFDKGIENINRIHKSVSTDYKALSRSQQLHQQWLEINISAISYLRDRKYSQRDKVYKNIDLILKEKHSFSPNYNNLIKTNARSYLVIFEKSVQANRIFLSLINVVMAGQSLELLSLSHELRNHTLQEFDTLKLNNRVLIENRSKTLIIIMLLSAPFLLIISFFFVDNISKGIHLITLTFDKFLEGDFNKSVPGLDRNDEIGKLAKAAEKFKLLNKELSEAIVVAQKSSDIKSEFLANMSHEIRTPMNGVLGMIEILKESDLSKEQSDMIKTISSSGKILSQVINDILDISKSDAGKISLEYRAFSFKDCVEEIRLLFISNINEKNISLKVNIDSNLKDMYLLGDVVRVKQILVNLVGNAIKFTEEGKVELIMQILDLNQDVCKLRITVKDTGVGIAEQSQKSLFDAFSQADTSITRRFGGTGLGLAISQKLANLMGSKIQFTSKEGVGTEFFFNLTLQISNESSLEVENTLNCDNSFAYNILLVEDNAINIKVASKFMEMYASNIDCATNGAIAVELCKSNVYDIVFMDMHMPIMGGVEACIEIKKNPAYRNIPVVALTANVLNEDRQKCFDAGMIFFLTKPISRQELSEVFVKIKQGQKAA
ncbi:ATP-binding protein [Halobacteriovorax sp. HLS]|uniref:ATP-binding protein n=1 Tax=Halobacteriovorax sp. HLS TaxID=2234000 RepID=UPI000FD7452D|nr:ATP-binding protein [Halobacteriovorax sp. HLS]